MIIEMTGRNSAGLTIGYCMMLNRRLKLLRCRRAFAARDDLRAGHRDRDRRTRHRRTESSPSTNASSASARGCAAPTASPPISTAASPPARMCSIACRRSSPRAAVRSAAKRRAKALRTSRAGPKRCATAPRKDAAGRCRGSGRVRRTVAHEGARSRRMIAFHPRSASHSDRGGRECLPSDPDTGRSDS